MYEIENEYEYADFKAVQNMIFLRRLCGIFIILLIGLFFTIQSNNFYFYVAYGSIAVISILCIVIARWYRLNNDWPWTSKREVIRSKFIFEKNHFIEKNDKKEFSVDYKDISRIYETKKAMYIESSTCRWYIIKKENCTEELLQFIRKYKQF